MTRAWLALLDAPVTGAEAQAALRDREGKGVGWLAAWRRPSKPVKEARRIDPRGCRSSGRRARRWSHSTISRCSTPAGASWPMPVRRTR